MEAYGAAVEPSRDEAGMSRRDAGPARQCDVTGGIVLPIEPPCPARFPLVLDRGARTNADAPREVLGRLLERDGETIRSALPRHGAVLLRETGVTEPDDLEWFLAELTGSSPSAYDGGVSPRRRVAGRVYTSTELPGHIPLGLHNELSYSSKYPSSLAFLGRSRATSGGETLLANGRAVLAGIDREVVSAFERRGVRYDFTYPGRNRMLETLNRVSGGLVGKTWMEVFETDDRALAEERCRRAGFEVDPSDGEGIRAHVVRPATITHPQTGEKAWFNHAHVFEPNPQASGWAAYAETKVAYLWPSLHLHAATYGDGSRIPRRALDAVGRAIARETVSILLEPTDLLLIDNLVCMHGRARFRGPRKVLVAMA